MIKDNIKNAECYYGLSDRIKLGFEWIKSRDFSLLKDGRYEISDGIYANLQTYETKQNAPFEAHRRFVDIQYMVNGVERCGYTDYKNCKILEQYDEVKDIEFLEADSVEYSTINSGEFFVFFPQDAHQPALNSFQETKFVKKVVVKVLF